MKTVIKCLNCTKIVAYNDTDEYDSLKSLSYSRMVCILWSVLKSTRKENVELKNKINHIEEQLGAIKMKMSMK